MRLKFFHFNNTHLRSKWPEAPSHTAVATLPTKEEIMTIFESFVSRGDTEVLMDFGIVKLHPKENYSKHLGRVYAQQNMKDTKLKVLQVEATSKYIFINFADPAPGFRLAFRLNKLSGFATVVCNNL